MVGFTVVAVVRARLACHGRIAHEFSGLTVVLANFSDQRVSKDATITKSGVEARSAGDSASATH